MNILITYKLKDIERRIYDTLREKANVFYIFELKEDEKIEIIKAYP